MGLALFPSLVDLGALTEGRGEEEWPGGNAPPDSDRHPKVCFDPGDPLFAQMGEDSRNATGERGEEGIRRVVDWLSERILGHLK